MGKGAALGVILAAFLNSAASAGTLEDIKARGSVVCGVDANRAGLSVVRDNKAEGLAAEFCGGLAAAVLGKKEAVSFIAITAADAYPTLQAEEVDVVLLTLPWRFAVEVEQGVMLVQPLLTHRDGGVFGPVVRHGDDGWFTVVRWTVMALQADGPLPAATALGLGLSPQWMADAVAANGNLATMLQRNEAALAKAGFTALPNISGPQF